LTDSIEAV